MLIKTSTRLREFSAGPSATDIGAGILAGLSQAFVDQYETAEIRTNATPAFSVDLRSAVASGPPSPVTKWLQPTVILRGRGGVQVIAPYGVSSGSAGGPLLLVLGLVGVGFILGRLT